MALEEVALIAQILGSLVIVGTLIYLSIQVRQGANLMRSESRQSTLNNTREHLKGYLENADLFDKMESEEKLSKKDQLRFSVLWITNMRLREQEWLQYQDGILDESTWRSYSGIIQLTLCSKRHRTWWNSMKEMFDPNFVEFVDELILQTPESNIWDEKLRGWDEDPAELDTA